MGSRLVNVRLDDDRLRKARTLRESGIALSDVVREAIDERFAAIEKRPTEGGARAAVERILAQYPDPPGLPARSYDIHDRAASRAAVVRRLRRRPR